MVVGFRRREGGSEGERTEEGEEGGGTGSSTMASGGSVSCEGVYERSVCMSVGMGGREGGRDVGERIISSSTYTQKQGTKPQIYSTVNTLPTTLDAGIVGR